MRRASTSPTDRITGCQNPHAEKASPQPHRRSPSTPRSHRNRTSPTQTTPPAWPRMLSTIVLPLRPEPAMYRTRTTAPPPGSVSASTRAEHVTVQPLGLVDDRVPAVLLEDARAELLGAFELRVRVTEAPLERLDERRLRSRAEEPVTRPVLGQHLEVRRDVARHDRGAVPGRLEQGQRQALERRRQDERGGVRVQLLERRSEDVAGEDDALVLRRQPLERTHEVVGEARAARDHELAVALDPAPCTHQQIGRLLGDEPTDD